MATGRNGKRIGKIGGTLIVGLGRRYEGDALQRVGGLEVLDAGGCIGHSVAALRHLKHTVDIVGKVVGARIDYLVLCVDAVALHLLPHAGLLIVEEGVDVVGGVAIGQCSTVVTHGDGDVLVELLSVGQHTVDCPIGGKIGEVVGNCAGLFLGGGEDGNLHVAADGTAVDEEGDIVGGNG